MLHVGMLAVCRGLTLFSLMSPRTLLHTADGLTSFFKNARAAVLRFSCVLLCCANFRKYGSLAQSCQKGWVLSSSWHESLSLSAWDVKNESRAVRVLQVCGGQILIDIVHFSDDFQHNCIQFYCFILQNVYIFNMLKKTKKYILLKKNLALQLLE